MYFIFQKLKSCKLVYMIREIVKNDLDGLLRLYMQLHDNPMPEKTNKLLQIWDDVFRDKKHHVIVAEENGKIVSSCVCVIIPNLTHSQQPYAFIENVITDENFRKRGLATQCLNFAKEIALKENCYKMMLLTGSKKVHWTFTERQGITVMTNQHLFNGYSSRYLLF